LFFFEKKNQKTFTHLPMENALQKDESLFSSFSAEKEVLPYA
jgi:hypothetical protein